MWLPGEPLLAQENIENYFPIPVEMMPNKQTFLLEVKGESMINAGIWMEIWFLFRKNIRQKMEIWWLH